jgi:hypothetical protein
MVERDFDHGWGWDASVGFYEGPFCGRKGKGSRAKGTFDVLIRITAGILAPSMEYWQSAPECGAACGIVGRDRTHKVTRAIKS